MGILDDLLAGAAGQSLGGRAAARPGGGMNQALIALLPVLLSMLASRGAQGGGGIGGASDQGGGLGDILGQMMGGGGGGSDDGNGVGGLGDILGQVLGGRDSGAGGGLDGAGGLGGLLQQLEKAGLGEQGRSWVGTGQNQPVSPEAIGGVFGPGALASIARRAGLSEHETSAGLAQLLPELVDRVTPTGQVPDNDQLTSTLRDLMRRLG